MKYPTLGDDIVRHFDVVDADRRGGGGDVLQLVLRHIPDGVQLAHMVIQMGDLGFGGRSDPRSGHLRATPFVTEKPTGFIIRPPFLEAHGSVLAPERSWEALTTKASEMTKRMLWARELSEEVIARTRSLKGGFWPDSSASELPADPPPLPSGEGAAPVVL